MKKHTKALVTLLFVLGLTTTSYYIVQNLGNSSDYIAYAIEDKAYCGDAQINIGEECDDGNTTSRDGCSRFCIVEPGYKCVSDIPGSKSTCFRSNYCGDAQIDIGEECDDGNTSNLDACLNTCERATCGDGFIRKGVEECDDGNTVNGDGCSSSCNTEYLMHGACGAPENCNNVQAEFNNVDVQSNLIVGGDASVAGNLTLSEDITVIGNSTFQNATVLGVLNLASLTIQDLTVNVAAQIAQADITNLNVTSFADILSADIDTLYVGTAATIEELVATGYAQIYELLVNTSVSIGTTLTVSGTTNLNGVANFTNDINIGDGTSDQMTVNALTDFQHGLYVEGDGTITQDLKVSGDIVSNDYIRADGIGRNYIEDWIYSIPNGTTGAQTISCHAGDEILSCNGGFINALGPNAYILSNHINSSGECEIRYNNSSGALQDLSIQMKCFAPDENWVQKPDGLYIRDINGNDTLFSPR